MKAELPLPALAVTRPSRFRARRDALVVAGVTLAAFFAASAFDLQERIAGLTRPLERFQADELVSTLLTLAVALVWFAWRRWRHAADELVLRLAAEQALKGTLAENRRLSQKYLLAQEEERRSLARELHDELGQCLNAIKLDAIAIRNQPGAPPHEVAASAQAIIDVSSRVYDVTRGLMERLRPVGLDELGLADALRHLVSEWQRRNPGVRCAIELTGELDGFGEQLNITAYRVIQECLTNVARHARASAVQIRLERAQGALDELRMRVSDDGAGMSRGARRTGLGLVGLRERVAALSGELEVRDCAHGVEVRALHSARRGPAAMSVRVLLVDDHAVVREGYRRLLERTPDIEVVAEASGGEDAYRLFRETAPDVVIMDITLPGMSGVEATRRIIAREPAARVLVFSVHEDIVFASRALQAGARGYITKWSAPDLLVEAVRAVATGRAYLSHDVALKLATQRRPGQGLPLERLSPREFEVFRLLAEGKSIAGIARVLSLSQKTVANYQSVVKEKLEADTSAQMVWIALEHGLLGQRTD